METQRSAAQVTRGHCQRIPRLALCPLSDPGPAAGPVGSCSPQAAALCASQKTPGTACPRLPLTC